MRPDKKKVYILEVLLLAILLFTLLVSKIYSRIILACLLTGCAVATSIFLKKRNTQTRNSKKVSILMTVFAVIYLVVFYLMGLYFGYYKPVRTFGYKTLIQYIIPLAMIIVSSEMMRSILLAQKAKFTKVLTFFVMVIIDLLIYNNIYYMETYDEIIEMIGFTFFASVACNLLYNYVSVRYGFVGNIIYRLITILYAYIIPIIPNVYIFFRSILRMVYPYIIYHVLEYTFAGQRKAVSRKSKRKGFIGKAILIIVIAVGAMLISCQFAYGMLIIGTGSMIDTINPGDAIIYERYNGEQVVEEGDIIIFTKENIKIVHRVVDKKVVNGETRYITKGDANQHNDEGYITDKSIWGISKFRIAYIGCPTIWLRDMISN